MRTVFKRMVEMPYAPKRTVNNAKTLSMVCPAIILANKRTERLTGLERYEITSMGMRMGAMKRGAPSGKKNLKNFKPCLINPMAVTATNTMVANPKVKIIWLVKVKA